MLRLALLVLVCLLTYTMNLLLTIIVVVAGHATVLLKLVSASTNTHWLH